MRSPRPRRRSATSARPRRRLRDARRPRPPARPAAAATASETASTASGRTSTDIVSPDRGGAVQVRSSRPRPAVWCSAITTRPVLSRPVGTARAAPHWSTRPRSSDLDAGPDSIRRVTSGRRSSDGMQRRSLEIGVHSRSRYAARRERHRHPHDRRQARRPGAATRRGRPRGLRAGDREAAREGQADRPRADRPAARRGLLHRARRARPAPLDQLRDGEEPARTATASSPATAPSTAARSACSPRTSRSSAAASARCSARRSSRSWTWR